MLRRRRVLWLWLLQRRRAMLMRHLEMRVWLRVLCVNGILRVAVVAVLDWGWWLLRLGWIWIRGLLLRGSWVVVVVGLTLLRYMLWRAERRTVPLGRRALLIVCRRGKILAPSGTMCL